MQTIWGRIFFFHRRVTNRAAADKLFRIIVAHLKEAELARASAQMEPRLLRGETSCKRSPRARPPPPPNVQWTRCMLRGEVPASKQLIPDLTHVTTDVIATVNCIKTQHVKAFWYPFPPCLLCTVQGNGPHPHGCFVSPQGLMAVTPECFTQLLRDEIPLFLAEEGSKNSPISPRETWVYQRHLP